MYKSRPITVVVNENINYILNREKITKESLYKEVGHQKIIYNPSANTSIQKLEEIAKFLGTNVPDLVTDWKDGSYPDEHEEYDRGYKDGRKDALKELYDKEVNKIG
ncbi:hypothetical protein [Ligilactobacillus salivarius]|uniref:XRE family transcriptional regulator n=1 Tax=Ligilactobacillus salivarius (strain UCC118) TaxID=362948 RepID=A0JQL8_LIGS1|nr:hypothetical protein [Ligilactobacillus salivarius]ABD99588.1 Hypothetical protein, phage associated [Ligilactobacillus salivarius UCC118]OQQ76380.1 hypothetical protein B6U64_04595 [Ligilactobacillus salivarius]OQR20852.1 hypothetical protein B6U40_03995 [Ligilactobacillus salivarius]